MFSPSDEVSKNPPEWHPASAVEALVSPESVAVAASSASLREAEGVESISSGPPPPVAVPEWHYSLNGTQSGPVTLSQLRALLSAGTIGRSDHVWKPGMPAWTTPDQIAEVVGHAPSASADARPPSTCPGCGQAVGANAEACPKCGTRIPGFAEVLGGVGGRCLVDASGRRYLYAGFWPRFGGAIVDSVILVGPMIGLAYVMSIPGGALIGYVASVLGPGSDAVAVLVVFWLICFPLSTFILQWLYFAAMESSKYQGTIGKRSVGIRVVDIKGRRITFLRATGRYAAKWLSSLILMIGWLMAGFTERKQALHDFVADTLVVMD
jgi:uncharacterized RDD family membrane protein YckC